MNPIVFVVLAAILIAGAFYLVALPILQHARRVSAPPSFSLEQERLDDLIADRDAAFQALRELNFDHRVGKITDDDFIAFEAHLKRNAAECLRALDEWERESDGTFDGVLEQAIHVRKQTLVHAEMAGRIDQGDGRACPKCGNPAASEDRFCAGCGAQLSDALPRQATAALECPACGHPHLAGDKFCPGCGQMLEVTASAQGAL